MKVKPGKSKFAELFPTKLSFAVFILYILLFMNQGILITASQNPSNDYNYNIISVVLMTEVLKLLASVALYCKDHSPKTLICDVVRDKHVLGLYFVPAFLYCLYNNLSFVNLSTFDPTTYFLLLQLRVVVTALLFQCIFQKKLTKKQWFSLLLLTFGCMLKQFNFSSTSDKASPLDKAGAFDMSVDTLLILVQVFCSCMAGVYNEYLLKKPGADVNIYVQNVYMYLDSIICNAVVLIVKGELLDALSPESLHKVFVYKVVIIMVNNAAIGIITSFFLKTLNSILKTFASALELVLTAIASYLLLGIPIYLNTVLAILTVISAVYLYSRNPISNYGQKFDPKASEAAKSAEEELLMEEV